METTANTSSVCTKITVTSEIATLSQNTKRNMQIIHRSLDFTETAEFRPCTADGSPDSSPHGSPDGGPNEKHNCYKIAYYEYTE